jgi:hypothetical protein
MSNKPFIAVPGQLFLSHRDWVSWGRDELTAHAEYNDTEYHAPGALAGWQGHHFRAMCFDQMGRRCRSGSDFKRAQDDDAYPIWWVWPDQIADLLMAAYTQSQDEEAQSADTGAQQGQSQPDTEEDFSKVMP